jgi:hypothetical protein
MTPTPTDEVELIDLFNKTDKESTLNYCLKNCGKYRAGITEAEVRRSFFELHLDTYLKHLSLKERYVISALADIAFPEFKVPDNYYRPNTHPTQ